MIANKILELIAKDENLLKALEEKIKTSPDSVSHIVTSYSRAEFEELIQDCYFLDKKEELRKLWEEKRIKALQKTRN
jgi:ribosomal protein L19E